MNHSLKTGLSFGSTSGIITTLGLIIGLSSTTASKTIILGGILTIAIADSLSDAMGIHVSQESENKHSEESIWASTLFTFLFKLIITLTFAVPVLLFSLQTAIIISIIWGLLLLAILSCYIAKKNKLKVILEHVIIAVIVIILTSQIGRLIKLKFI